MTAINGVLVYRELGDPPAILIDWLDERQQLFNVLDDKQKEHLYVDNDQPRDADITPMILEHTIGFSLFTEDGRHTASYSRLDKALRAQAKAKLVVVPEVDLEDDIEDDEDDREVPMSAMEAQLRERIAELESQVEEVASSDSETDETVEDDVESA